MALIYTSDSRTVAGAIGDRHDLTLGHEAVGIVTEVGSEVSDFKPGDRVVAGAITPDWGSPTQLTTYVFSFDDIESAFEMMRTKADGIIKPLIQFNGATRLAPAAVLAGAAQKEYNRAL